MGKIRKLFKMTYWHFLLELYNSTGTTWTFFHKMFISKPTVLELKLYISRENV